MRSASGQQKTQGQKQSKRKDKVNRAKENTKCQRQQQGKRKYEVSSRAKENTRSAAGQKKRSAAGQKKRSAAGQTKIRGQQQGKRGYVLSAPDALTIRVCRPLTIIHCELEGLVIVEQHFLLVHRPHHHNQVIT